MVSSKGLQPLRSASRSIGALPAACARAQTASRRYAGTLASFKIPVVNNEPNVSQSFLSNGTYADGRYQYHYTKGSVDRKKLQDAVAALKKQGTVQVPLVVAGEHVRLIYAPKCSEADCGRSTILPL
jgi:1-pyrroline-5-carboxylate dehydrogenase